MAEDQEYIDIAQWVAGDKKREEFETPDNTRDFDIYGDIISEIDTWSVPPVDKERGKALLLEEFKKETKVVSFSSRLVLGIAASVTLLMASYLFFFLQDGSVKYSTNYGETRTVSLPDGSSVTINARSSLAYNKDEWDNNRFLEIEGEAYFEVVKGKTFEVKTLEGVSVKVLGTRFNVRQREKYLAVECFEGSVSVIPKDLNDKSYVLKENDGLFSNNGELLLSQVETKEPSWVRGKATNFKNAPLGEVLEAISAQFGVSFQFDEAINLDQKFTGSFVHSNVELALKMVCDPLNISFTKVGQKQYAIKN